MISGASPHPVVYFSILAAVFCYLYGSFRKDHFLLWAAGWSLLFLRQLALYVPAPADDWWIWMDAGVVLAAAALVVAGGVAFAGRRRLGAAAGLVFGLALAALTGLAFLALTTLDPSTPRPWAAAYGFLAAGWTGAGWLVHRFGRARAPIGSRVAGISLALWGAIQAVAWAATGRGLEVGWIPPADAALGAALAIGMVILGIEEARAGGPAGGFTRGLLDDDPNLVAIVQNDSFVYTNRALQGRLGRTGEEMAEAGLFDFVAPEYRAQAMERLARRRRGSEVPDYELDLMARDGSRVPVIVHGDPIEWEGAPALKYELTDISTRRRAEEEARAMNQELQRTNAELEKSNRLKSEFLSNTSHELKTPLTSIIANTEILEYEMCGPVNDEQKQILDSIARNSQHLLEMISRLLDFARYEEGGDALRYERVDPRTPIDGAVRTVTPLLEGRPVRLEVDVEEGLEPCWVDGEKIYRVYLNLVENAVKYSDSGTIRIGARRVGDELEGFVTDEGIGIPPDHLGEIFDAFRQVDASPTRIYQGVGLGLAICKQLVEIHRGRIWAESTVGRGSRFLFRVPYRTEAPDAGPGPKAAALVP
ncbi:MAG TPA: PAS domain-containing sensor histidine kinase [Gemmatimonadota bacterium]|nr:PAS domain-containing sensor histidine kinase [Gemmatimonadota bacterium]